MPTASCLAAPSFYAPSQHRNRCRAAGELTGRRCRPVSISRGPHEPRQNALRRFRGGSDRGASWRRQRGRGARWYAANRRDIAQARQQRSHVRHRRRAPAASDAGLAARLHLQQCRCHGDDLPLDGRQDQRRHDRCRRDAARRQKRDVPCGQQPRLGHGLGGGWRHRPCIGNIGRHRDIQW